MEVTGGKETKNVLCSEGVKAPLAIGDVLLQDGSEVKGFVGEAYASKGHLDISSYGGWRQYKESNA
jgi:allophanate hydrolase